MLKIMATGAVTFIQCFFYRWRFWQRQRQRERQQEQQQENQLPIYAQPGDDISPLGFDFDQLEMQDDHQRFYQQLLADKRKLNQQLREQELNMEQRAVDFMNEVQRLQFGKEAKDDKHHEKVQLVKHSYADIIIAMH